MIKMQMIGRLGKDCVISDYNGEVVVNFSVAHTDRYKDGNGVIMERATWVNCSWWTDKQLVVQYLKKGQMVYLEGIPEAKLWKDKREGKDKAFLNMRVLTLQLVGGSGQQASSQPSTPVPSTEVSQEGYKPMETRTTGENFSDLPF